MKINYLIEKMSTGAQTIELTNLLVEHNMKWFKEYKLSNHNSSYIRTHLYAEWILHNKKDELENVLLKFGKTLAPSLTKVSVNSNYDGIASCFSPSDFSIYMASTEGVPVVVWNEFGDKELGPYFSRFVSTFIHELYHAVQYERKRGIADKSKKTIPLSNDSSYWTDRNQNVGDSNTKTYDHHTVTKVELEAMANDQFSETLFNQFAYHDHQTIIRYYPTWSKFMSKLRSIGRDPESVAQKILKRNDGAHFNKDNKIEAEAIKYFIKEYLKVVQDFYYKGMDDETGKYEKQRELGANRKK